MSTAIFYSDFCKWIITKRADANQKASNVSRWLRVWKLMKLTRLICNHIIMRVHLTFVFWSVVCDVTIINTVCTVLTEDTPIEWTANSGVDWTTYRYPVEHYNPDSKVHGANVGPILGRQEPGGPHVGHMNFAIWEAPPMTYSSANDNSQ